MAPSRNSLLSKERERGCRVFLILLPVETHYRTFLCFRRMPDEAGISPDCEQGLEVFSYLRNARHNCDSRALKMGFKRERVRSIELVESAVRCLIKTSISTFFEYFIQSSRLRNFNKKIGIERFQTLFVKIIYNIYE